MKCLHYLEQRFPCGQCIACRLNKQREKALRLSHELQYHKNSVFVTLTYAPENLPEFHSLVKKDVQDFLKKVRKRVEPDRIRYFACGEYGSEEHTSHPHYHLIIFGLSYNDKRVFENVQYNPSHDVYYCKCKVWDKGFVSVGKVSQARINYVAKYVVKKVTGKLSKQEYGDRLPEFSLCSRNPGLGYQYALDHLSRLKQDDCCTVRGRKMMIPRYYIDKFYSEIDKNHRALNRDKAVVEQIKEQRPVFDEYGLGYSQLLKDRVKTAKEIIARKLQMKGKTKCQVS